MYPWEELEAFPTVITKLGFWLSSPHTPACFKVNPLHDVHTLSRFFFVLFWVSWLFKGNKKVIGKSCFQAAGLCWLMGVGVRCFGRWWHMEPWAGVGPRGYFHAQTHRKILIFLSLSLLVLSPTHRGGTQAQLWWAVQVWWHKNHFWGDFARSLLMKLIPKRYLHWLNTTQQWQWAPLRST